MNEAVNNFLSAGDKIMPEMDLRKPVFTHSACEAFTKNTKRIQNLKKQEIPDVFT